MTGHRCSIGLMFKFAAYLLLIGGGLLCLNETKKQYNKKNKIISLKKDKGDNSPGRWAFYWQRTFPEITLNYEGYEKALMQAKEARQCAKELTTVNWELVGPTNIGGRVTDIEMHPTDTLTVYVGAASGGVFKSDDLGRSWLPVFDEQMSLSIGDIGLAPSNPKVIYVGTGEANAGGGSITYDGVGVFKSVDGGNSWQHMQLEKSRNIGRIAVHPTNENIVFVGAMGSLFANNPERGVFRSKNGGEDWKQVLAVSDSTGCIDLAINRLYPDTVYAAMWERIRRPNERQYGGRSCGLYRSANGGDSWVELTEGLPFYNKGRIGINVSQSHPHIVYAIYANEEGYFQGVYKSVNGGEKWKRVNDGALYDMYKSYGWWFGNIRVDPNNPNRVYALGLDVFVSDDGGNSWRNCSASANVHCDQHGMFIHPLNSNLIMLGNDGGVYASASKAAYWTHRRGLPITQFYSCSVNARFPNVVYGGTQDNGIVRGATDTPNAWEELLYGDGFKVLVDPTDSYVIYSSLQYGALYKSYDGGLTSFEALSGIDKQEKRNWNTPILFDSENPDYLYYGTTRVYQSTDGATTWLPVSPILTKVAATNGSSYGTITSIATANSKPDLMYVGTDDGQVWQGEVNDTSTWQNIGADLPKRWVSQIAVDPNNHLSVYVCFSGYRFHDYVPHVFYSDNGGDTWQDISSNLPEAPVNDIVLNDSVPNALFVATDVGVFKSDNKGDTWEMLGANLPNVPITDIVLHHENQLLIAATYGRSMYRCSVANLNVTGGKE